MDVPTPEEVERRNAVHWSTVPGDMEKLAEQCCDEFYGELGTFQDLTSDSNRKRWRRLAEFLWGLGARPKRDIKQPLPTKPRKSQEGINPATEAWTCPTCGDPQCGEV